MVGFVGSVPGNNVSFRDANFCLLSEPVSNILGALFIRFWKHSNSTTFQKHLHTDNIASNRHRYWSRRLPFRAREREADERDRQEAAREAEALRELEKRNEPAPAPAAPRGVKRERSPAPQPEPPRLSPEERKEKQKELVDSLPSDQKGLQEWPVKWEVVDEVGRKQGS